MNEEINCIGCKNIASASFPFSAGWLDKYKGQYVIDTEGCGETQDGESYLLIYFCPVCGRNLKGVFGK